MLLSILNTCSIEQELADKLSFYNIVIDLARIKVREKRFYISPVFILFTLKSLLSRGTDNVKSNILTKLSVSE